MFILGYDTPVTDEGTIIQQFLSTVFLTPKEGLADGRPGTQTLIRWGAGDTSRIQFSFPRAIQPGVAIAINVTGDNISPTTQFRVTYARNGGAFDYQQMTTNLIQFPNGDIHGILAWPDGLEDDVDAARVDFIDASMDPLVDRFTVGEIFIAPAIRTCASLQDFQDQIVSRTASSYSSTGQPTLRLAKNVREARIRLKPEQLQTAYGETQAALNRIADNPLCFVTVSDDVPEIEAVIPGDSTRTLSMYGAADFGARGFVPQSRLINTPLNFREIR